MDKEPSEIDEKELEKISGGDDHLNRISSIAHQVSERYHTVTTVTSRQIKELKKLNEHVVTTLQIEK